MIIRVKKIIFLFVVLLLMSCSTSKNSPNNSEILNIIEDVWNDLGIKASTEVKIQKESLNINITYYDDYFILDETNQLINSIVLYSLDPLIASYDTVRFTYKYDDLSGVYSEIYPKTKIKSIQNESDKYELFQELVIFILKELNNYEVVGYKVLNEDLIKLYPKKYGHRGSFWLLLYNFSLDCCDTSSTAYKSMHLFRKGAHYPKQEVAPFVIDSVINYCEDQCE